MIEPPGEDGDRPGRGRRRAALRGLLLDVAPLRLDRHYRWLWTGQAISGIGNQVTRLALPYQVYVLTGSTLAIAGLTFVQLVAILALSLGGGSLADAVDRRRLLLVVQGGQALGVLALAALSMQASPPLAAILAVAFVVAGLSAVDQPARGSSIPRLVPPERLPSALALNQLNQQAASIIGPAIGGLLIATVGLTGAYLVDVVTFSASLIAILALPPLPPLAGSPRPGLAAIREGLAFVRRRRDIQGAFVIDLNAMIFGMPTALFPALALDVFRVGPAGLGLLAAAPAVGAFLGALLSGWVSRVVRVGRAVVVAVAVWAAAILAFGLAAFSFPLALLFLAIAGAADMLSAVFRNTMVQLATPDELRGRVLSIHVLVVTSGPRVGDIEAAAVASLIGPQLSVVSGGLLCLLGVVGVARRYPELVAHRLPRAASVQSAAG